MPNTIGLVPNTSTKDTIVKSARDFSSAGNTKAVDVHPIPKSAQFVTGVMVDTAKSMTGKTYTVKEAITDKNASILRGSGVQSMGILLNWQANFTEYKYISEVKENLKNQNSFTLLIPSKDSATETSKNISNYFDPTTNKLYEPQDWQVNADGFIPKIMMGLEVKTSKYNTQAKAIKNSSQPHLNPRYTDKSLATSKGIMSVVHFGLWANYDNTDAIVQAFYDLGLSLKKVNASKNDIVISGENIKTSRALKDYIKNGNVMASFSVESFRVHHMSVAKIHDVLTKYFAKHRLVTGTITSASAPDESLTYGDRELITIARMTLEGLVNMQEGTTRPLTIDYSVDTVKEVIKVYRLRNIKSARVIVDAVLDSQNASWAKELVPDTIRTGARGGASLSFFNAVTANFETSAPPRGIST